MNLNSIYNSVKNLDLDFTKKACHNLHLQRADVRIKSRYFYMFNKDYIAKLENNSDVFFTC